MHSCNARCAAWGVEAAPLQLRLFSTMVDAVLSYGSEVWGMQLAAASAAGKTSKAAGSNAESLHLAHLRRLLGAAMGTAASGGAGRNGGAAGPPSASLQISSAERL
ncbi:hypothetical protein D9Q98_004128 [Chlorella vulgaris]|uniref:Uncharacterized protein n=1 Tax=Chlorella vulgaris TaxID=3077 RepID=A0A9D4YXT6_CHLVU|nr:hypothetical protein D9Q98_004128 [Chlorella vulgaris]